MIFGALNLYFTLKEIVNREGDFKHKAHDFRRRRIAMVPPRRNSTYKPSLLSTQQTSRPAAYWLKQKI